MTTPLLEVKNLSVRYPIWGGIFRHKVNEVSAVDDVSFTIDAGETLGLVGESGCGKTTIAKAIVNIHRAMTPGVEQTGQVIFHSEDGPINILELSRAEMRPLRSQLQIIFQDPFSSLNPRMTVGNIIETPLRLHSKQTAKERRDRVSFLLDRVGLQPEHASRYPHEFSGGQRQRVGIARALAVQPKLIVADEAVSALDVSVQAQVLNLLGDLQEEFGLTYLFVAHDLSVVHHISDRIAVMYLGKLVEFGGSDQVYRTPLHPYSRALISAVPQPVPRRDRSDRIQLIGEVPTPLNKPSGCPFRTRCPIAKEECADAMPELVEKESNHRVACPYSE
ncbi:MAG: ATP-binding cassette domain-containing protein [Planctomycetaceae bacterium]|nr:ATP-binding cassette domain-containing protein [Planctomycetaceae bacterium]